MSKAQTIQPKQKKPNQLLVLSKYLYENWFWSGLLACFLYIFFSKNITVHIAMENNPMMYATSAIAQPAALKEVMFKEEIIESKPLPAPKPKAQMKVIDLVSILPIAKPKSPVTPSPSPQPISVATPVKTSPKPIDNAANNFSNISAVLVKDFARRYGISQAAVDKKKDICNKYVNRFSSVAVAEMKKYGIPASITMAQGLLESDAGGSRLSRSNDNHFGIKCFASNCKKGHCSNFTDDTHKDFFRKYNNSWESYRAHSLLLQGKRYKDLKKLGTKNYKDWAHGLQKAGYATDKKYAEKLIKIIEAMGLDKFDS